MAVKRIFGKSSCTRPRSQLLRARKTGLPSRSWARLARLACDEPLELAGVVGVAPAGGDVGGGLEVDRQVVLGVEPGLQHVELQLADHAHDPLGAELRPEHLGDALLGQVLQRRLQVLGPHRVAQPHAHQDLGREVGDAGEADRLALARARRRPGAGRGWARR